MGIFLLPTIPSSQNLCARLIHPDRWFDMKTLPAGFLPAYYRVFSLLLAALFVPSARTEEKGVPQECLLLHEDAVRAASVIEQRLTKLRKVNLKDEAAGQSYDYEGLPLSRGATHLQCLRADLRTAFAKIELAKQHPAHCLDPIELLDLIISGKGDDFFGSDGHLDHDPFVRRTNLLDQIAFDRDLLLGDRLFDLIRVDGSSDVATMEAWLDLVSPLLTRQYLGSSSMMSVGRQSRCIRTLYLFGIVLQSQHARSAANESKAVSEKLASFHKDLARVVKSYVRERFERDGPLRDRALPVLTVAQRIVPELTRESVGVTSHRNYQKFALSHARGLASLVRYLESGAASPGEVRQAIGQIIDYRVRPFYIGSREIREKGSVPCPRDRELEMLIDHAQFFGEGGHHAGSLYRSRLDVLEKLFLSDEAVETRDYLMALKTPLEWLGYFKNTLVNAGSGSCLDAIRKGEIREQDLENLFLARCILPHRAFDTTSELRRSRDQLKGAIIRDAPDLAVELFQSAPSEWNLVDLAFLEISKLCPDFSLEELSIPTFEQHLNQREEYLEALKTIPTDLLSLEDPASPNLINNEVELFESDYVYRTGKFDRRLSPGFIESFNHKLSVILAYRNSMFTPPDTTPRPGLEKVGNPLMELQVLNRNHPDLPPGNPQLHDLIEGAEGGLGGIGQFLLADPRGYESRESAMDAIAICEQLELSDSLFHLAMDAGMHEPTDLDRARAAKKWLRYFRKTQSTARLHSTPEELTKALRGAFLCRLVVQCEDFIRAVERSPEVAVGSTEDVSSLLEASLTNQVSIMSSLLSSVDPSTALNRDVEYIKERWYKMKAWHTESLKWLEAVIADPVLMSEVSRIRQLSREKTDSYDGIAPSISRIEETLSAVEPRIISDRHSNRHEDMFKPLDFANLIMGQLVTLENATVSGTLIGPERSNIDARERDSEARLSREINMQLFSDIRGAVAEAGFEDLSEVTALTQFPRVIRAYYQNGQIANPGDHAAKHEFLLQQLKGAIAKAKGRIEAEKVTDLKTLEDLSLRASRADRIYFSGDPDRYSLVIDPSFLLHEWNNRHKVETIAEFRTIETRAQAQTQIFRLRQEREKLLAEKDQIAATREETTRRLELAKSWAVDNGLEFDPDSVIDEMIRMEDQIHELKARISEYEEVEEKFRHHHLILAQKLHSYKVGQVQFDRKRQTELLLAMAAKEEEKKTAEPEIPSIIERPKPRPQTRSSSSRSSSNSSSSRSSSSRSQNSSSSSRSSRGGFFRRMFGRR